MLFMIATFAEIERDNVCIPNTFSWTIVFDRLTTAIYGRGEVPEDLTGCYVFQECGDQWIFISSLPSYLVNFNAVVWDINEQWTHLIYVNASEHV